MPIQNLGNFDPNAQSAPYATFVTYRRPQFKVHSLRAHATTAANRYSYGGSVIYEWDGAKWVEVVRLHPTQHSACAICLVPAAQAPNRGLRTRLARDVGGRLSEPLTSEAVCEGCS